MDELAHIFSFVGDYCKFSGGTSKLFGALNTFWTSTAARIPHSHFGLSYNEGVRINIYISKANIWACSANMGMPFRIPHIPKTTLGTVPELQKPYLPLACTLTCSFAAKNINTIRRRGLRAWCGSSLVSHRITVAKVACCKEPRNLLDSHTAKFDLSDFMECLAAHRNMNFGCWSMHSNKLH